MQVALFMSLSLFTLAYAGIPMPYKDPELNFMNIYNELIILIFSYFVMILNGVAINPD